MMRKIRAAAGRLWRGELSGCALVGRMHLSTLLHASGTERKVLFFEWMVFGPVGEAFGAETMLELFGATRREQAELGVKPGVYDPADRRPENGAHDRDEDVPF